MLTFTQGQVEIWLAMFWWPFLRLFGLLVTDPFFSSRSIPVRVRVGFCILVTLLIARLS